MGQLDLITLDIHAIINKRFKMRTGYIVLLVALFVMVAMVGQSDATPQPEPVADPLPWPQYVWNVVKNIPSGAMGVFKNLLNPEVTYRGKELIKKTENSA